MPLSIRVQFLAGYSGREWPPSPARLFKAMVCAGRSGWAVESRSAIDAALRQFEGKAPIIAAPEAMLRAPRQRRFVPNNSKSWPLERKLNPKKSIDLEEEPIWSWEIPEPPVVWYQWPDVPSTLVATMRALTRRSWSVGKGEDFAVLDVTEEPPPYELKRWSQTEVSQGKGPWLEIPEAGCLDCCDAVFCHPADDPPLAVSGTRSVQYATDQKVEIRPEVFVLGLWFAGKRCSWDARLLRQVAGPIRNLLNEIVDEIVDILSGGPADRARYKAIADRVLLGHDEYGGCVLEPHLAILPIPSVLGPFPDGRIRRVALVDFGDPQDSTRRAIVDMAHVLLHGRELIDRGSGMGVTLKTERDGEWLTAITRTSQTWVSVTPVIQVAKELTAAEWARLREMRRVPIERGEDLVRLEQRRDRRRLELLVWGLTQAIGPNGARPVSVEALWGGPIAGVHIARQYRIDGYLAETPRIHVRVKFDRPVGGPLAIGRGRHAGFGLLCPVDETLTR